MNRPLLALAATLFVACGALDFLPAAVAPPTQPTVLGVRGKIVAVRIPPGFESITVNQVTNVKRRILKPLVSRKAALAGETVMITLRSAVARRALLVTGIRAAARASDDGAGLHLFLADPALTGSRGYVTNYGLATATATVSADSLKSAASLSLGSSVPAEDRSVTESDIWQKAGDRLFFFNQLRGLQVFDVSNPDDPALLGQMREPNRGEQMYLLGPGHVALLVRPSYYFSIYGNPATADALDAGSGAIVIADVTGSRPVAIARLPYAGHLVESRLVGTALYVVSQTYDGTADGLQVTSFDLKDPASPKQISTLALGSYGGVVAATDRFLFVTRYSADWRRSIIDVIDISAPNGRLYRRGKIDAEGIVGDKFKMHLDGNTLTVVSSVPRNWSGDAGDPANLTRTAIESFDLSQPARPMRLDSLSIGTGETVRATRFTDGRLYVVTFFQIDPLWVIDLAEPRDLKVLAELEIPGFSNYIEPLGDRLVAVGRLGAQTAVSLFDIADPAAPRLLSQLPVGSGYSYSEANWDEKAFYVNAPHELILLPFSGYDAGNGYASQMQIITLKRDSLTLRGVVNEGFAARRATIVQNRFIAISATNLATLDLSDRDHPRVTSNVEIAWRVDRVFLQGDHLVQVGGSAEWNSTVPPTLTISPADNPDAALTVRDLENVPVVGATARAGRLYVAQRHPSRSSPIFYAAVAAPVPANPLILTIFDISALPTVTPLGRVAADYDVGAAFGAVQLDPIWINAGTLLWTRPQWTSWWWRAPRLEIQPLVLTPALTAVQPAVTLQSTVVADSVTAADPLSRAASLSLAAESLIYIPPYYRQDGGVELIAFDVRNPAAPAFASAINPRSGNTGDWSAPISAGDRLFVSFLAYDDPTGVKLGGTPRAYRHFLKTIDYSDPTTPMVGDEVNIPGRLLSVANAGSTLLTTGCWFETSGEPGNKRSFHTSHFDGTAATLVDQLESPAASDPFAVEGATLLLGSYPLGAGHAGQIQAWAIGADGKFAAGGSLDTPAFYSLSSLDGLLVGFGAGLPRVFDIRDPANLVDLSSADTSQLTGGDLRHAAGGAGLGGIWQPLGTSGVGTVVLP